MNAQALSIILSLFLFALITPLLAGRNDNGSDIVLATMFCLAAAIAIAQFVANSGALLAL